MKKKKAYLELHLKDEIVEGPPEHSVFSHKARTSLHDLVTAIHAAARDPRVAALALKLESLAAGWAQLSDIRRALVAFREKGKTIYSHISEGGNAEYFLASAGDRIFMPPAAHLQLVGLSAEIFFLKDLLERFGVDARLQAIGEYKSAAEMFTRTGMSAAAREQLDVLMDDLFEEVCTAIQSRGFDRQEVRALIDGGPYSAREALQQRLLDGICYPDELAEKLREALGKPLTAAPAARYSGTEGLLKRVLTCRRARIGVIHITGQIDTGESRRNQTGREITGSDTIARFLDHARDAKRIRAILLRIDSPGGSALASDSIWRKVVLAGKGKPVVVSFGDTAASGGYYVAAPAAHIMAEAASITGSIGVVAGKFIARELMTRLSIQRESVLRGAHAGQESLFSDFSEEESRRLHQQMHEFYREDFLKKVAEGRNMDLEEADCAGRGRVWSGRRAQEQKLVDGIGGFMEAIQQARRLAGIPDSRKTRTVFYCRHRRLWERFLPEFRSPIAASYLPQLAGSALDMMENLGRQGLLLLMPFRIRIR